MDTVAYRLVLPPSLSGVHELFHVSMLRKYTLGLAHIVDWGEIIVDIDGTFEEGPMHILDSQDKQDRAASESVVETLTSGGGNLGTRGHDAGHLSFPI